MTKIQPWN